MIGRVFSSFDLCGRLKSKSKEISCRKPLVLILIIKGLSECPGQEPECPAMVEFRLSMQEGLLSIQPKDCGSLLICQTLLQCSDFQVAEAVKALACLQSLLEQGRVFAFQLGSSCPTPSSP